MALDFFLAENLRSFERGGADHVFALEEDVHCRLFACDTADLPMLRRLDDFSKDARFGGRELPALRNESVTARSRANDPEVQRFLTELAAACERAVQSGLLLVAKCD